MRLHLHGRLLGELIRQQGGVKALLDAWSFKSKDPNSRLDRATVYRWIKGETFPKNWHTCLQLAGHLDVDPFALIEAPTHNALATADEILKIVQSSSSGPSAIQFVHAFFGRQLSWPPDDLASTYFGRRWHVEDFVHDPNVRSNYYAVISLSWKPMGIRPQVFHFAFRHPSMFAARWLEYGLVRADKRSATLYHINGYTQGFRFPRSGWIPRS